MGEARDQLGQVNWARLAITWLDYTDVLTTDILRDVDYVIRVSQPGSVVVVTVNGATTGVALPHRLTNLRENLGHLVDDVGAEADVGGWGPAQIQRQVLQAAAHTASSEAHGVPLRQLFNFNYADNAKMLTWGGIVSSGALNRTIDSCRFEDLPFVRPGEDAAQIRVPYLTEREGAWLEAEMVGSSSAMPTMKGVVAADIRAFSDVHRWRVGTR